VTLPNEQAIAQQPSTHGRATNRQGGRHEETAADLAVRIRLQIVVYRGHNARHSAPGAWRRHLKCSILSQVCGTVAAARSRSSGTYRNDRHVFHSGGSRRLCQMLAHVRYLPEQRRVLSHNAGKIG